MNTQPAQDKPPAILHGARLLAVLSLIWSGYAITDLMHSGLFGLSVAVAGDVGWVTVLWAEYRGITLAGQRWAAPAAGWLIALGVALLLVIHGHEAGGRPQAIAGPFVVLVGKIVWAFALAAMKDPTEPTPEQRDELHTELRDSAHSVAMMHARAQARIAHIRTEASVTVARDEADFEIGLERLDKQAALQRRTPLALTSPVRPAEPANANSEQSNTTANVLSAAANSPGEQVANKAITSPAPANTGPSMADLVREHVANNPDNRDAVAAVMAAMPTANRASVAAAVRRQRRHGQGYN
ncbi:hypothetical protein [Streptomyces spinosisporus]|uniref:Protein spdB n=1 Tax=Streptomyces spinosisporus TaxID=2927582 RepID=A0ABS9XW76_9ACTN|nr:hypothetical protein [Streptomyces spinosisporus]MCI3246338.1 hypothetical protein [Streptomyces spinosisporus]